MHKKKDFFHKYGSWALIAGGSEGIGSAFSHLLARQGFNLAIIARRKTKLVTIEKTLVEKYAISVRIIELDLADSNLLEKLERQIMDLDIGLVVYNPANQPFQ